MVYELLMGNPPFTGTMDRLLFHHLSSQPAPPSTLRTDLSEAIDSVILRALAKRPEERFPSIMAFAQAFGQAVQALPTPAPSPVEDIAEPQQSEGGDFRAEVYLTQVEADAGASRTITMPNGQTFTVPVPGGVHDGEVIRVQSSGESPNSGKVVFLTIGIKQAEETPTVAVFNTAPTLLSPTSNEEVSSSSDVLSTSPTLLSLPYNEGASQQPDVLSTAPTIITHAPVATSRPPSDPVSDPDLSMKDASSSKDVSDSKAPAVEKQPAPSLFKRAFKSAKRLISGSE
jgi:serine/threonine protein kinase